VLYKTYAISGFRREVDDNYSPGLLRNEYW